MRKTNKSIILFSIIVILLFSMSSVYASDNTMGTDVIENTNDMVLEYDMNRDDSSSINTYEKDICSENAEESVICDDNNSNTINSLMGVSTSFYFNSSKEISGDGSSWENANNSAIGWTKVNSDGCTIYLADGNYTQNSSFSFTNAIIIGQGKNTCISFYGDSSHYAATNHIEYTFINLTFTKYINPNDNSIRNINFYEDFNFINCSFVDVSMVRNGWTGSTASLITTFENCEFSNITQKYLITNGLWGILKFNNCTFENITADSIVNDDNYICWSNITNSVFKNCSVKGILYLPNINTEYIISNCTYDFEVNITPPFNKPKYVNTTDYNGTPEIYINTTRDFNGDGSCWENATNDFNKHMYFNGLHVHLAEGEYSIPETHDNVVIIGLGEKTIIKGFSSSALANYASSNRCLTVINCTFNCRFNLDGLDFKFINCSFENCTFVFRAYPHSYPNRDTITDVCSATFENCKFSDYAPDQTENPKYLFINFEYSRFIFNNCSFDNISCDALVDSYGGNTDNYGRFDGIYIYNSSFTNCIINGVAKVRQASYCNIKNCTYDFPAGRDIPLVGPFYINITDVPLVKTNLNLLANGNTLIITLTDESNRPLVDYEVEIVTNGKVSYDYTDDNGKIVLSDLLGNYSFEITFPGDEYEGYSSCKVFRNLTFEKAKQSTALAAPKVSATYNIAKNLVVTLKSNGKALANKKVTVNVGFISKTLTTNKNGQVSIAVSALVPKTYTASIKFAGDSNYKASSVTAKVVVAKAKPKLVVAKKTFKRTAKTKKVTATLKNNKGKVLKKVKLTLKVAKITYTAKTNSKGVATFKVKLTKKGTYTGTVKFAGSKYFKALTKKVKIIVKK